MSVRIGNKPLRELSDRELDEELRRRREARGYRADGETPRARHGRSNRGRAGASRSRSGDRPTPGWKLRQWYRNLELEKGASRDEIELAYVRLSEKYHPDRQDDEDRKALARQLAGGLREAYRGILASLDEEG